MKYAGCNSMIITFVRDTRRSTYAFNWDAYFDSSCLQVGTWLVTDDVLRDTSEGSASEQSRNLYFSFGTTLSEIALRLLCINYLHATCPFLVNVVFLCVIHVVTLFHTSLKPHFYLQFLRHAHSIKCSRKSWNIIKISERSNMFAKYGYENIPVRLLYVLEDSERVTWYISLLILTISCGWVDVSSLRRTRWNYLSYIRNLS